MWIGLVEVFVFGVVGVLLVAAVFSYVRQWHKRISARYYVVTKDGCLTCGAHEYKRLSRAKKVKEATPI